MSVRVTTSYWTTTWGGQKPVVAGVVYIFGVRTVKTEPQSQEQGNLVMVDNIPDRVCCNEGPYYQPPGVTSKLEVVFNGVKQTEVVEFCISEQWIQKYKKDWRGRPSHRGGNFILGPRLRGTLEVSWKVNAS